MADIHARAFDAAGEAPRCPLCCEHGRPLTGRCGWCENDYDPDHMADVWIPDDKPMWLCPHGIGIAPDALGR